MKKINKILLKQTLINHSVVFLGVIFWVGISLTGKIVIDQTLLDDPFYPIALIFWLIIMLKLMFIIPRPITTYSEEEAI